MQKLSSRKYVGFYLSLLICIVIIFSLCVPSFSLALDVPRQVVEREIVAIFRGSNEYKATSNW